MVNIPQPKHPSIEEFDAACKHAAKAYIDLLPHMQAMTEVYVKAFMQFALACAECQKQIHEARKSGHIL